MGDLPYEVIDPRPIAASARYTFFLPSAVELAAIGAGDLVKLTFRYVPPGQEWDAERMWVGVEGANDEGVWGYLESTPDDPGATVQKGDRIIFQRYNILDIVWKDSAAAPEPQRSRQYWDRCLVDAGVLDGDEPVAYLYREEPDMTQEEDRYPDSGWRIRGRDSLKIGESDRAAPQYVALGAVLNRDDSWLHLIDAPVGTSMTRDLHKNEYIKDKE